MLRSSLLFRTATRGRRTFSCNAGKSYSGESWWTRDLPDDQVFPFVFGSALLGGIVAAGVHLERETQKNAAAHSVSLRAANMVAGSGTVGALWGFFAGAIGASIGAPYLTPIVGLVMPATITGAVFAYEAFLPALERFIVTARKWRGGAEEV